MVILCMSNTFFTKNLSKNEITRQSKKYNQISNYNDKNDNILHSQLYFARFIINTSFLWYRLIYTNHSSSRSEK